MTLRADSLSLTRGGRIRVRNLTCTFNPGSFHALIGPNGAGKSLSMRCLAGWDRPDSGEVFLDDRPLRSLSPRELARARAVVGQESEPSFDFDAQAIVRLGAISGSISGNTCAINNAALSALAAVGLEDRARQPFGTLSGGEKQRVHLARALLQLGLPDTPTPGGSAPSSRWLLVDEPTSALDLHQQHAVLSLLRDFTRRYGTGVCAILHDINLAALYADQIWAMKAGCLIGQGTPDAVLTPDLLDTLYGLRVCQRPTTDDWPAVIQTKPY